MSILVEWVRKETKVQMFLVVLMVEEYVLLAPLVGIAHILKAEEALAI